MLLGEEVVQADGRWVVLEDQGGTELMLGETLTTQNTGVLQRFEQFRLSTSRPLDHLAFVERGTDAHVVNANPSTHVFQRRMGRLPVLITGSFVDHLVEHIVADFATALRGPNPRLLHPLGDSLSRGPVMRPFGIDVESVTLPVFDDSQNSWSSQLFAFCGAISQTDVVACCSLQFANEFGCGTEHNRFHVRHAPFTLAGFLSFKEGSKLFGFGVGELVRIVDRCQFAIGFPGPGSGITTKPSRLAFNLDEEETLWSKHQQIHFIDAAIVGDEFKIGPGSIRLMRRELGADKVERFSFPRKARLGNRGPVLGCCHLGSHSR